MTTSTFIPSRRHAWLGASMDGQSVPTTTSSFSATLTWKRMN